MLAAYSVRTFCKVALSFSSVRAATSSSYITVLVALPVTSRKMTSTASNAGWSAGISATCLVNRPSWRRITSRAVAAMKSPMVAKCRNNAPSDTWARRAITAAEARAYPTSTMVSILASRSRETVSSRRCCWVLAMSGRCFRSAADARPQEVAGLRGRAVPVAEVTVAVDDRAVDSSRDDCGVVAVDHAAQAAIELDLLLVVAVHRVVKARRIDDDEVGPVTFPQGAGVEAEPVRNLAGEPVDRSFDGQEWATRFIGVEGALEQPQGKVVEGHVAQVRTGIGETHMDGRLGGESVEVLGPVVGDDRRPANVTLAVFDQDVEKSIQRVQTALLGDLPEALADQALVRALDDGGVVKVPMPQARSELAAVEMAPEPAAVFGVSQKFIAFQLISQVQGRGACAELFEDRQIDSVGVQLERHGKMLEPHEGPQQPVQQPGTGPEDPHGTGCRLGVGRHEQAHPHARTAAED